MAKKRFSPKSVFIACEGKNTEPLYFEKIKEVKESDDFYPYALTIYPDRNVDEKHKTDAIGLINEAIERIHEYDELWVVFDKDGYTKHKEAFELAESEGINICFSSISFETWVLLHFELNVDNFDKSANIINDKFQNNEKYFENYSKSGDLSIYPFLEDKTEIALINSSYLKNYNHVNNLGIKIYDLNPYTDVDVLVKKLLQVDINYEHCLVGQQNNFKNLIFTVNIEDSNIVLNLYNGGNTLVLNEFQFFVKIGDETNEISLANRVLEPKSDSKIVLYNNSDVINLVIKFENLYLTVVF